MFKAAFLTAKENLQMELISELWETQLPISLQNLMLKHQLSKSALLRQLHQLAPLLHQEQLVLVFTNQTVQLDHTPEQSFQIFYLKYLQKTDLFQILRLSLMQPGLSVAALSQRLHMGTATLYRRIHYLNQSILNEFQLQYQQGELVGSELQIRYFYEQFILAFAQDQVGDRQLFGYTNVTADQDVLTAIERFIQDDLSEISRGKIRTLLAVYRLRRNARQWPNFSAFSENQTFARFAELVRPALNRALGEPASVSELVAFFLFVITQSILNFDQPQYRPLFEALERSNHPICRMMKQLAMDLSRLNRTWSFNVIRDAVFVAHLRAYWLRGHIISFNRSSGITVLFRQLSRNYRLAKKLVTKQQTILAMSDSTRALLTYQYALALRELQQQSSDRLQIGVAINLDRSESPTALRYFEQIISLFCPAEIELYTPIHTYDLILADHEIAHKQTFIVTDVPLADDYMNLYQKVEAIYFARFIDETAMD